MVINTPDAILVADKDAAQEVKSVIGQIEAQNRSEHLQHREDYRPWGCYDSVDSGTRYQVKRITVKPGARLSLDRKSTRLNSSHVASSYAVFCLKKEK